MNPNQPAEKISMTLTRPALERLIDNDPELEVRIGHQVLEAVAKTRVLKAIWNDTRITGALNAIQANAQTEVLKRIGTLTNTGTSWSPRYEFKPNEAVRAAIDLAITRESELAIKAVVATAVDQAMAGLDELINKRVQHTVDNLVQAKYEAAIKALKTQLTTP